MDIIAIRAEVALHAHPHPALTLSELVDLIAEQVDRGLTPPRLRVILEGHPEHFRIIEPWHGPWRTQADGEGAGRACGSSPSPAPIAPRTPHTPRSGSAKASGGWASGSTPGREWR
jgi:hypothetical protein